MRLNKQVIEDLKARPQCPECGSHLVVKDGKQLGKQTYLCKVCYRRFTPTAKHKFRSKPIREQAIRLFVNGMSINAIAKSLNIPYTTVYMWIRKAGKLAKKKYLRRLRKLKEQGKVRAISIDEAWSFVGKKGNSVWIWSVVVEYGDGKIEKYLFVGDRSLETFFKRYWSTYLKRRKTR